MGARTPNPPGDHFQALAAHLPVLHRRGHYDTSVRILTRTTQQKQMRESVPLAAVAGAQLFLSGTGGPPSIHVAV